MDRENAVVEVGEVYNIKGIGIVIGAKIINGVLKPSMKASINGKNAIVRIIEDRGLKLLQATTGENVAVNLYGIERQDIQKGSQIEFT